MPEPPRLRDGQVVLADVHVVGARTGGEVGTVVDDERHAEAVRDLAGFG